MINKIEVITFFFRVLGATNSQELEKHLRLRILA